MSNWLDFSFELCLAVMIKPGGENLTTIKAVLIAVTVSSFPEKARKTVFAGLWVPQ